MVAFNETFSEWTICLGKIEATYLACEPSGLSDSFGLLASYYSLIALVKTVESEEDASLLKFLVYSFRRQFLCRRKRRLRYATKFRTST